MRALLLVLALCVPCSTQAGLLDLLPLKRIERKMIYPLSTQEVDPTEIGLKRARAFALNSDDNKLIIWTLTSTEKNAPTVLYFHGNSGNLAMRAQRFASFQQQGFNVIAMSYRGSSGSAGVPSEAGITDDALHVYQRSAKMLAGATPDKIVLYGESLGSAVAIALLDRLEPQNRPAGLVLEAPFTSTPAMALEMADIPDNLIARISDRWDSLGRAPAITTPTLILHGTQDEVTPIKMGRAIFNAVPISDKDFIAVRDASHSGTWRSDTLPRLYRFIRTYAR